MALVTRPKPAAHHKKVVGKHHKTSKHYAKAYWPYLPLIAVAGVGLLVSNLLFAPGKVLGSHSELSPAALLSSTNQQRQNEHEPSLSLDSQLNAAAQAKANDMVTRNYWAHIAPDGRTPWSFIANSGYNYRTAGENLAYGFASSDDTVSAWMNSAEHRANVLNANYRQIGFGIASSTDYVGGGPETVVVALYGQPNDGTASLPTNLASSAAKSQVLGLSTLGSQPVSRIQVLTGGTASWSVLLVTAVAIVAASLLAIRHARAWHRVIARGELFVVQHPWLDVTFVTIMALGYSLTRVAGIIH